MFGLVGKILFQKDLLVQNFIPFCIMIGIVAVTVIIINATDCCKKNSSGSPPRKYYYAYH
jgi:hypothetical protein